MKIGRIRLCYLGNLEKKLLLKEELIWLVFAVTLFALQSYFTYRIFVLLCLQALDRALICYFSQLTFSI